MNTPVKHAKFTALGKKCNPNGDSAKHRKFYFSPKRKATKSANYSALRFYFINYCVYCLCVASF